MADKTIRYRFKGPTSADLTRLLGTTATVASPALGPTIDVTVDESAVTGLDGIMSHPNHFESLGEVSTPNLAIGVCKFYRNASLSISSSLTKLDFDATSTVVTASGIDRTGGDIVPLVSGVMRLDVCASVDSALLLSGLRLKVTRDPNGSPTVLHDVTDNRSNPDGHRMASCSILFNVAAGVPVRCQLAVTGAGSADLVTSETTTYANAFLISS